MKTIHSIRERTPLGVILITLFYMFGAIVLLITLFTNPVEAGRGLSASFGLSPAADAWILPSIATSAFLISFGLFSRSRWGYFLSIAYFLYFGGISLWLISHSAQQPYIGNFIWSFIVLIYLAWKREYFLGPRTN